jgi:hypothetical protein
VIRLPLKRRWRTFFLIQTKGSAFSFQALMKASICSCSWETAVKEAPLSDLALKDGEPCLDLIEPGSSRWGEMEMHSRMLLQPALVLLVGIEIIQHDVKLAVRKSCNDLVHEAEEFDAPAPLFVLAQNLAGRDIESREQGPRPMPLVVVALAGQGPCGRQLQIALRPLQGLNRGLLIDAEHDGLAGRVDIEADDIGCLGGKIRIVALLPGLAGF